MKHIPDLLWSELARQIFTQKNKNVGRPLYDNRKSLNGILYVLYTGCQWGNLPEKYGKASTIHGKYMRWCRDGTLHRLFVKAREYYRRRNSRNNWFAFDALVKKAPFAQSGGKNPTDRSKRGVKQRILVDRKGAPLFVTIAPANTHDSKLLPPIIKQLRTSKKIRIIVADSAFDSKKLYQLCKKKLYALFASHNRRRSKKKHKIYIPHRWIVEQTFEILNWFRGIKTCWSKTYESTLGSLQIVAAMRLFKMAGIFRISS